MIITNNPDIVVCQVCGKHLRQINNLHCRVHGMTTEQYKIAYPEANIIGSETSHLKSLVTYATIGDPNNRMGKTGKKNWCEESLRIRSERSSALMREMLDDPESYFNSEERKIFLSKTSKRRRDDPNDGWGKLTEDAIKRLSEIAKKRMVDSQGMFGVIVPNKCEAAITERLNGLLEFASGRVWLTSNGQHITPDFVSSDGSKKVVEFFGDYWHPGGEAEANARIQLFRDIGWDCLVVWEHDWASYPEIVHSTILKYILPEVNYKDDCAKSEISGGVKDK